MNIPLMPTLPRGKDPITEDREGCEFIDEQWVPKHPDYPVEKYHFREGSEFVNGEWKEKPVSGKSSRVAVRIISRLEAHAEKGQVGFVLDGECGYQIHPEEPRRVRKPDLSLIRRGRLPEDRVPDGNIHIAPDLAGEVVSPNDEAVDLNNKVMEFLRAGVRLVWVFYPESRSVWVFRADGSARWLAGDAELGGEDVVPGFSVQLSTIFADI